MDMEGGMGVGGIYPKDTEFLYHYQISPTLRDNNTLTLTHRHEL